MHDMDYAPFMDLLREVIQKKPDVLILLGPFVDISQPIISSGDVVLVDTNDDNVEVARHAASYEMVFIERIITGGLQLLFDSEDHGNLPTKIILVPSLLDAHHEFVFPQPPFGDRDEVKTDFFDISLGVLKVPYAEKNEKKRVYLMPNPCMFRWESKLIINLQLLCTRLCCNPSICPVLSGVIDLHSTVVHVWCRTV